MTRPHRDQRAGAIGVRPSVHGQGVALAFDAYPASEVNALAPPEPALATKTKSNTDFVHPFEELRT